jgi:sugar (pentulose or hexulose) kinase
MEHALGRRLSPVLVSGGGSRSDLMMQIVADVYGRPARRTTVIYPGWDQATAAMVSPGQQFTPDPGAAPTYQQINQVYATLISHTDPLFRSMADGLAGLDRT